MKAKELAEILLLEPSREVVLASDPEGNDILRVDCASVGGYDDKTYPHALWPDDRSEAPDKPEGCEPAICIWPRHR